VCAQKARPVTLKTLCRAGRGQKAVGGGAAYLARLAAASVHVIRCIQRSARRHDSICAAQLIDLGGFGGDEGVVNGASQAARVSRKRRCRRDRRRVAETEALGSRRSGQNEGGFKPPFRDRPYRGRRSPPRPASYHRAAPAHRSGEAGRVTARPVAGRPCTGSDLIILGRPASMRQKLARHQPSASTAAKAYREEPWRDGERRKVADGAWSAFSSKMSAEQLPRA